MVSEFKSSMPDIFRRNRFLAVSILLTIAVLAGAVCSDSSSTNATRVFADADVARLAAAAAAGDATQVNSLIKAGVDPNAVGDKGTSLLQWALLNQSKAGLEALIAAGADPAHTDEAGDTLMHYAAKANDASYLDILLAHRVDPNLRNAVTGVTPLMSALLGERHDQFRKLLAAGANPGLADRMGNTAVHVAAKINESQHVLEMLQAGADPASRNAQGATFQRYLNMTPIDVLSEEARREREGLQAWLKAHDVPLEDVPRSR